MASDELANGSSGGLGNHDDLGDVADILRTIDRALATEHSKLFVARLALRRG